MQQPADKSALALHAFLQENMEPLLGIIRSYVARAGLAKGETLQNIASEVLNEATLEALAHIDVFHTVRQPRAWFLGIAANVIKRRRASLFKQSQRELLFSSSFFAEEAGGESDFFDQLSNLAHPGPEQEVETRTQVAELLALALPEDRRVLRLAFLQDLDTSSLALALNVSPGSARVRLHRALNRLRSTWRARDQQGKERGYHA